MTARLLGRLRDERGVALVLAIITVAILAGTTTALLLPGAVDQRNSYNSASARQAFELAQAALSYGEGAVYQESESGGTPPSTPQTISQQSGGGTGTWTAAQTDDGCSCKWLVTGVGTMNGSSRTVSAVVTTSVPNPSVWNYMYSDATGNCATSISGSSTIGVPLLTKGGVCLSGSVKFTGSQLYVGGNLSVTGSASVGSSSKPISDTEVAGTPSSGACTVQPAQTYTVTPGTSYCNGKQKPVYSSTVGTTIPSAMDPVMPCIGQPSTLNANCTGTNNGTWSTLHTYYNAQAGLTQTGCPAGLFDNDTTLNDSDTGITNAMFSYNTSYDCKIGSDEIKFTASGWNATMYVNGPQPLYFDGSVNIASSWNIVYSGQASMYFTGGVTFGGSAKFCGITSCTASWDPSTNGIIFIAGCWNNSTGSSLITSSPCVYVGGSSKVQVGAYSTEQYEIGGSASNMGPVLSNNLNLAGSSSTLIPFNKMPPGTPLNTGLGLSPTDWSG